MRNHELKIEPKYFERVVGNEKKFEIRLNDRDFQAGDGLVIKEYLNGVYTGRELLCSITYVLMNVPGLKKGYCIFSLQW